jgi:lysophospholipase L1-like esterase
MAAAIFLATGEIALRVIYRDAGKQTLGGPGGRSFEHLTMRGDQRGRLDTGSKGAKPRIMIVGDSITWGQGVREWQDTWPEQLARALESGDTPYEMAVFAMPGRDIPDHAAQVERWIAQVAPDVFIYQWYVNDIEVEPRRPSNTRSWQQWPGHEWLRKSSYLYYFLDNRLTTYLPPPDRSYVDYILQDYAPESIEWSEFERYFHTLAMQAKQFAPRRLLVLYPQVPFRGTSPLQPLYDRVAALTKPHELIIPHGAWIRYAGTLSNDAGRSSLRVPAGTVGPVIDTRDYYFSKGPQRLVLTVSVEAPADSLATVALLDATSNEPIATAPVTTSGSGWQDVPIDMTLGQARRARLRIASNGRVGFSIAKMALPVDYGFAMVDLTSDLNTFNTHTSIFDAHPNESAHKLIAERVFQALGAASR